MIHPHKSSNWSSTVIPRVVQLEMFVREVQQTELQEQLFGYSKISQAPTLSHSVVLQGPFASK